MYLSLDNGSSACDHSHDSVWIMNCAHGECKYANFIIVLVVCAALSAAVSVSTSLLMH